MGVQAAGMHFLDAQLRAGGGPPHARVAPPMTPGREVTGRVELLGPDVDPSWPGEYVIADLGVGNGRCAEIAVAAVSQFHRPPVDVDPPRRWRRRDRPHRPGEP